MLTLKSKMNTNAQPEPLSEDVVIITDSDDFDKLRQNPDCVCVIVKGCSYIEIGAFEDMKELRQVILRGDIVKIGVRAFEGCEKLSEIYLPDSVKTIGFSAFRACASLERVRLPHGLEEIESGVFAGCEKLREIRIPAAVTLIESNAFANCTALERVYGGEGLETVENAAFLNCKSLKHFPFSQSVCDIHAGAFESCPLHLPVTYYHALSPRAKYGSRSIAVPDGVETIGSFAFGRLKPLKSVVLPDSVRNISRYAFADWDERVKGYPIDFTRYLPAEMNMPKGYLRQQEQFDAIMALTLCNSVWKGMTDENDFASIALFQNDKTARFLAAEMVKEKHIAYPYMEISKNAIAYMRTQYRHIPGDMLHLAEFLSFFNCKYYRYGLDPEFNSLFEGDFYDDEIIDSLCHEAFQCGAGKAADLFEKYCRKPSGGIPYVCLLVSPYEADWLLTYRFGSPALIGESDLHYTSGERIPKEFVRSVFASAIRSDVLNTLLPGCFTASQASDLEEFHKAFASVSDEDWLELLRRNPEQERDLLTMMCRYSDDGMLKKLFEHYCRLSENWSYTEEITRTNMWLQAFNNNESYTAKKICAELLEILEDLEDEEEYELEDWHFDWQESSGEQNEQSKTESFDGWDDDWEESSGGETGEQSEQSTSEFFDDTYYEEGMDIFGEHYADDDCESDCDEDCE